MGRKIDSEIVPILHVGNCVPTMFRAIGGWPAHDRLANLNEFLGRQNATAGFFNFTAEEVGLGEPLIKLDQVRRQLQRRGDPRKPIPRFKPAIRPALQPGNNLGKRIHGQPREWRE
jgi:hypothetical protein